nr:hypothetical protein GCM10020093_113690 [Planobispora longispora]
MSVWGLRGCLCGGLRGGERPQTRQGPSAEAQEDERHYGGRHDGQEPPPGHGAAAGVRRRDRAGRPAVRDAASRWDGRAWGGGVVLRWTGRAGDGDGEAASRWGGRAGDRDLALRRGGRGEDGK